MVKQSLDKRKRGRPKGSKNKRIVLPAHKEGSVSPSKIREAIENTNLRYKLKTRTEKNILDKDQEYYFIYDLNRGELYPEIIARFTVETEARLCVEFLNETRKISKREYNEKRIYIL